MKIKIKVWDVFQWRGMHVKMLASLSGIGIDLIYQIEQGRREGALPSLRKLAKVLEVHVTDLIR